MSAQRFTRPFLLGTAAAIAFCAAGIAPIAAAQSVPPAPTAAPAAAAPDHGPAALETIVVTAQRRSEKLERTPVAVTAITASDLKEQSIKSESDIQSATSGVLIRQSLTSNQLNYAIRGQSVDAYSTSQPGVLPYFDEVQQDSHAASSFYDLQSIQVLKGPQGTLFGRNSTGGAVLLTSTKPGEDLGGYITGDLGNYDYEEVQGAINVPIVPGKVLLRVAGDYDHRSGYVHDVFDNSRPGEISRASGRVSLEIRPSSGLTNLLVVDYVHSGGTNNAAEAYSGYAPGSINNGIPLTAASETFYSPLLDTALGFPGAFAAIVAGNPGANPLGLADSIAQQRAHGPYWVDSAGPFTHRSNNTLVSNITSLDLGENMQIKNIAGFNRGTTFDLENTSGAPFNIIYTNPSGDITNNTDFSDELQLLGKAFSNDLSYVAGFYFLSSHVFNQSSITLFNLEPLAPGTSVTYQATDLTKSYAGYAQGTYDLARATGITGLGITAGIRFTRETNNFYVDPQSIFYQVPGLDSRLYQATSKASWQLGVQEQLNSNLLLYVVSRRSFRSGGFNNTSAPLPGTADVGGASFNPEIATDVEVGAKFDGRLAGIPIRVNADFYNEWIKDAQRIDYIALNGSLAQFTVNVPKAQITGVEGDFEARPSSWLNVGANFNFTNARYTDGTTVVFGQPTTFGPYADTPRWSGAAFAKLIYALPDKDGIVSLRADIFGQTKFYFSNLANTNSPGTSIAGYSLLNFRLAVDDIMGSRLSIAGYMKNALNKAYYAGGIAAGPAIGLNVVQPGVPRTFYAEVSYKF